MAQLLLEKGADLNMRSVYDQQSTLYYAAKNGHIAVVQWLLDLGATTESPRIVQRSITASLVGDVDWDESYVDSASHAAIAMGHHRLLKLLIARQVPIRQDQWEDALGHAAFRGDL